MNGDESKDKRMDQRTHRYSQEVKEEVSSVADAAISGESSKKGHDQRKSFSSTDLKRQSPATPNLSTSASWSSSRKLLPTSPSNNLSPVVPAPTPPSSTTTTSTKRKCPLLSPISKEGEGERPEAQAEASALTSKKPKPTVTEAVTKPKPEPPSPPPRQNPVTPEVVTYTSVCAPPPESEIEAAPSPTPPPPEVFKELDEGNESPSLLAGDDIHNEMEVEDSPVVEVPNNELLGAGRNWRDSMKSAEERYDFMRRAPRYRKYLDVKFIVGGGGEPEIIFGHEQFLVMKSEYFEILFEDKDNDKVKVIEGTRNQWPLKEVHLTDFDPKGFNFLIDYIYTGKIDTSDLSVILKAANCAQKIGHSELMGKLWNYLKMNLTKDNAVQIYCLAVARNDLDLVRKSMTFISSNISDVVHSDGFLKLSEEDLCRFLESDEWTLGDEVKVFELVKRWATHEIEIDPEDPSTSKKISSEDLRRRMGRALYGIRFTEFSMPKMFQLFGSQPGLLSNDEIGPLVIYVSQRDAMEIAEHEKVPSPPRFVVRPRGVSSGSTLLALEKATVHPPAPVEKRTLEQFEAESENGAGAEAGQRSEENESPRNQDEFDSEMEMECSAAAAVSGGGDFADDLDNSHNSYNLSSSRMSDRNSTSARKQEKIRENLARMGLPGASIFRIRTLEEFKMDLSDKVGALGKPSNMTDINETLLLTEVTSTPRIYLPKLKKFEVRFVKEKVVESGANLKKFMKKEFSKLRDILFFDVEMTDHNNKLRRGEILENLLGTKVNILITFAQSTILLIDHDQGKIIMNMLKGSLTDEILGGCRKSGFRLKILGISDCDLTSLNLIPKKDLEVLQIRLVRGLVGQVGPGDLLELCPNLKSVRWGYMDGEYLQKIEVEQQISKLKNLEHLSLMSCSLVQFGRTPFVNLKTLLLDHCTWDRSFVLSMSHQIFPSVKKVLIYGEMGDSENLYWILKAMPSIEWIFMWEMEHCKLKAIDHEVKRFMSEVFDETFANKKYVTFILKKKKRQDHLEEEQEGGGCASDDDNDASTDFDQNLGRLPSKEWEGEALLLKSRRYKTLNEWAFEFNRNEEFFKDFGVFKLMDTKSLKTEQITEVLCSPYYRKEINEDEEQ